MGAGDVEREGVGLGRPRVIVLDVLQQRDGLAPFLGIVQLDALGVDRVGVAAFDEAVDTAAPAQDGAQGGDAEQVEYDFFHSLVCFRVQYATVVQSYVLFNEKQNEKLSRARRTVARPRRSGPTSRDGRDAHPPGSGRAVMLPRLFAWRCHGPLRHGDQIEQVFEFAQIVAFVVLGE